jgi:hypothetical protein
MGMERNFLINGINVPLVAIIKRTVTILLEK